MGEEGRAGAVLGVGQAQEPPRGHVQLEAQGVAQGACRLCFCPEVALFYVPSRDRNGTVRLLNNPMRKTPRLVDLLNELGS